jgi:fatty-acyl-CoA synthase
MLRPISDTAFARPQITEVVEREAPAMLIYDVEFADAIADVRAGRPGYIAWHDDASPAETTLEQLIAQSSDRPLPPPAARA